MDVPVESPISLRFSKPLRVETANASTVTLLGAKGFERVSVVPAEGGMLAFVTPEEPLLSGTTYVLSLNGLTDAEGFPLPLTSLRFTTERPAVGPGPVGGRKTPAPASGPIPQASQAESPGVWTGEWRDGRPYSRWQALPPLEAEPGVTALSGQVLQLNGEPLANVTLEMEGSPGTPEISATTDESGRFLLTSIASGWCELVIDGRTANQPGRTYGVFEVGIEIKAEQTNILPYTIWMPWIDTAHAVTIASPTTSEVVVTNPEIRGLEVHIPANTVIRDHEGNVVTEVSITPIPLDRPPFPLPRNVEVPVYFPLQPGGAYVWGSQGVRIIYPNWLNKLPGTRFNFWHYEPGSRGWYVYGLGTVTEDGKQVVDARQVAAGRRTVDRPVERRAGGGDVDDLQALQRQRAGRRVVELDELAIGVEVERVVVDLVDDDVARDLDAIGGARRRDRGRLPGGGAIGQPGLARLRDPRLEVDRVHDGVRRGGNERDEDVSAVNVERHRDMSSRSVSAVTALPGRIASIKPGGGGSAGRAGSGAGQSSVDRFNSGPSVPSARATTRR